MPKGIPGSFAICSVPKCPNRVHGQGYCSPHYWGLRRSGELTNAPRLLVPCSVEGCPRTAASHSLCDAHYRQVRRGQVPSSIKTQRTALEIEPIIEGDVAWIPLTKGKRAVIDAADVRLVKGRAWQAMNAPSSRTTYASTSSPDECGALLHRVVMGFRPDDPEIDHIDGDGLNNRRSNLREATSGQNQANVPPRPGCSSRFKGVHFFKRTGRFQAYISADGKRRALGYFTDEEDAARAYDAAARELHGEFAYLNFPESTA